MTMSLSRYGISKPNLSDRRLQLALGLNSGRGLLIYAADQKQIIDNVRGLLCRLAAHDRLNALDACGVAP